MREKDKTIRELSASVDRLTKLLEAAGIRSRSVSNTTTFSLREDNYRLRAELHEKDKTIERLSNMLPMTLNDITSTQRLKELKEENARLKEKIDRMYDELNQMARRCRPRPLR